MRKIAIFLSACICICAFNCCKSDKEKAQSSSEMSQQERQHKDDVNALIEVIKTENMQLPEEMESLTLTSITYARKTNIVIFNFDYDGEYLDSDIINQFRDTYRAGIAYDLQNSYLNLFEATIKVGATVELRFVNDTTGEETLMNFTTDELLNTDTSLITESNLEEQEYEAELRALNEELPINIDEGLTATNVYDNGGGLTYVILVDENIYDFQQLINVKDELKEILPQNFDSEFKELLNSLVALDKSLTYRFKGSTSGRTFSIEYTPYQLYCLL